ncbi:MAG: hypothetical protein E7535_07530 [Ruminococcaceae bacterium]|nr:hypothetical protein [Oscillospiraceae bacterium]
MKTNNEMIECITQQVERHNKKVSIKRKAVITVSTITALMLCLLIGAGASGFINAGTPEHIEYLKEKTENAKRTYTTEKLRQLIEKSDDIYSVASREDKGSFREILLDYDTSVPVNQTVTNGGYIYKFISITEGKKLDNVCVSGSPLKGTAEFEWQIFDSLYALFEITRTDGEKITDDNYVFFRNQNFVIGTEPLFAYMNFTDDTIYFRDDNTYYMAVELNDMRAFAGDEFVICFFDATTNDPDPRKNIYATADGIFEIKDHVTETHALFRFRIDEKHKDLKKLEEFKEANKDTVFFNPNYDFYK